MYDFEKRKLQKIVQDTKEQIQEDNTIRCTGHNNIMTDCNQNVSASSIALRELILYSNLDKDIKNNIQTLLQDYGMMFEAEYERLFENISTIKALLDEDIANQIEAMEKNNFLFNEIDIMEKVIDKILLKYYHPYSINKDEYDEIVYNHTIENDICDILKHHYKCLHNPNLKWNQIENNKKYQYQFNLTYKDIKTIVLWARDSGGNLDCFGFCHDGTTMNCVVAYIGEKLGIEHNYSYNFINLDQAQQDEIGIICDEVYDIVCEYMGEFRCSIY